MTSPLRSPRRAPAARPHGAMLAAVVLVSCAHAAPTIMAAARAPSLHGCTPVDGATAMYGVEPLLRDYRLDPETTYDGAPVPLDAAALEAYVGAQRGQGPVLANEGELHDGAARVEYQIRRDAEGTVLTMVQTVDGDCPSVTREAMGYDASGRLAWRRRTHEGCELVDARIEEDTLTLDARGRFLVLRRITYAHPAQVEGLVSQALGPTLTLPDGTMPPEQARETCRFAYDDSRGESPVTDVECTHEPLGETSLRLRCDAALAPPLR